MEICPAILKYGEARDQKPKINLAIFGPFPDLQDFFENRGLTFETSESEAQISISMIYSTSSFMWWKIFLKNKQILKSYFEKNSKK